MNKPRVVLAESAILRQLFAIQDGKRMQNKELAGRAGMSPDRISELRRGLYKKSSIEHAEALAEALGYELVLRPKDKRP